jgi:hypothetical protein
MAHISSATIENSLSTLKNNNVNKATKVKQIKEKNEPTGRSCYKVISRMCITVFRITKIKET